MSYRFMRVLLFFDLPTVTNANIRDYTLFRRYLIKNGFIMIQESVYSKLALNATAANAVMGNIRKNSPPTGLIQMISITEKQFSKMEYVVGGYFSNMIDSEERLIIL